MKSYTLVNTKLEGQYLHNGFIPCSHEQICTLKSKLGNPSDWLIVEVPTVPKTNDLTVLKNYVESILIMFKVPYKIECIYDTVIVYFNSGFIRNHITFSYDTESSNIQDLLFLNLYKQSFKM